MNWDLKVRGINMTTILELQQKAAKLREGRTYEQALSDLKKLLYSYEGGNIPPNEEVNEHPIHFAVRCVESFQKVRKPMLPSLEEAYQGNESVLVIINQKYVPLLEKDFFYPIASPKCVWIAMLKYSRNGNEVCAEEASKFLLNWVELELYRLHEGMFCGKDGLGHRGRK